VRRPRAHMRPCAPGAKSSRAACEAAARPARVAARTVRLALADLPAMTRVSETPSGWRSCGAVHTRSGMRLSERLPIPSIKRRISFTRASCGRAGPRAIGHPKQCSTCPRPPCYHCSIRIIRQFHGGAAGGSAALCAHARIHSPSRPRRRSCRRTRSRRRSSRRSTAGWTASRSRVPRRTSRGTSVMAVRPTVWISREPRSPARAARPAETGALGIPLVVGHALTGVRACVGALRSAHGGDREALLPQAGGAAQLRALLRHRQEALQLEGA
jgi:hypothetical protein